MKGFLQSRLLNFPFLNRFLNNIGFLGSNEKNYKNGSVPVCLDSFDWDSFVSCKDDFCKKPLY